MSIANKRAMMMTELRVVITVILMVATVSHYTDIQTTIRDDICHSWLSAHQENAYNRLAI